MNTLVAFVFLAQAVAGFPNCDSLKNVTSLLASKYGEHIVARGIHKEGRLMLVYANEDTLTWSIVTAEPNGVACLALAGVGFDQSKITQGEGI